ncbi:hypothetical protein KQI36_17035 [Clostridium senegalense]|uniref:hypothetical protein n=1 Tax=Clostridium senegalense TaxID=1465809 RepID=UPI001C0F91A5|nr:hypothetical protein [Clostridium senegalense]MBU5228325.1 hypothetical protein [Clostridium senegalense]
MEICRAYKDEVSYLKYEESYFHNTAIIAKYKGNIVGVLEYNILDFKTAQIVNISIFNEKVKDEALKELVEEISYWNPYLKEYIYKEKNGNITVKDLNTLGFIKKENWVKLINNNIKVFKIYMKDIKVEQLTVERDKLKNVERWIKTPETIIITYVLMKDKIVPIDGYSRLIAAYKKGFSYVYGYLENEKDVNMDFFKTCIKWCENEGIFNIDDLSKRIVSKEEHKKIWVDRCRKYFENN